MITKRGASERGRANFGWLDSKHSFSFGSYYDPSHMGFGPLRVINEDRVKPGAGFDTHGHQDMEIISYVLEGALEHKDSIGTGSVIRPGDVQRMSAGTGVTHSESNGSDSELVHFLQIWVVPDRRGLQPRYDQKAFDPEAVRRGFTLLASRDGRNGSIQVQQDMEMEVTRLGAGARRSRPLGEKRHAWVHVARGAVTLNEAEMGEGDGAAVSEERTLQFEATSDAEILVFDLA